MADPIPEWIVYGPDMTMTVKEIDVDGEGFGYLYLEEEKGWIIVNKRQPEVGKHNILLHEIIHLANEKMLAGEIIKEAPPEEYTEALAGILFQMLAQSGLWKGVTPEEAKEFLEEQKELDELERLEG